MWRGAWIARFWAGWLPSTGWTKMKRIEVAHELTYGLVKKAYRL